MQITSFWPLFFFAVAFQGLFLATVLFARRRSNRSNIYLALLIALFSLATVDTIIFWTTCDCETPGWLGISLITTFLYGPLLYFYLRAFESVEPGAKGRWKHFLAAIIVLAWHVQFIVLRQVNPGLIGDWNASLFNSYLLPLAGLISLIFYGFLSFKYVLSIERKHSIKIINSWHWLGLILNAYLLFVLFHFIYLVNIASGQTTRSSDITMILGYSVLIYTIGYLALQTSSLLNGIKVGAHKYRSTLLPSNFSESMFKKLQDHMRLNKPYTRNEIKLAELADELSLAPHQLSQIINQHANKNFAEYINAYRVEEAIALISEIDRLNELAFEVGFNNRTTFNKTFKQQTGLTPSAFRKQMAHGLEPVNPR